MAEQSVKEIKMELDVESISDSTERESVQSLPDTPNSYGVRLCFGTDSDGGSDVISIATSGQYTPNTVLSECDVEVLSSMDESEMESEVEVEGLGYIDLTSDLAEHEWCGQEERERESAAKRRRQKKAGGEEEEEEDEDEAERTAKPRRSAVMRARVLEHLIEKKGSTLSSRILDDIRQEVEEEVEQLKADMREVEERARQARREVREGQSEGAAYLLAINALHAEKAKLAVPTLLDMSDTLDIDLLQLTEPHLAQVIGTDCVVGIEGITSSVMRTVTAYRDRIQHDDGRSPSSSSTLSSSSSSYVSGDVRSTSALSTFLAGQVPAGIHENDAIVSAASSLSTSPPCHASEWRCAFGRAWSDLRRTLHTWQALEGRIEEELKKESTIDDIKQLGALLKELELSGVDNEEAEKALKERIHTVANAATGLTCWRCDARPAVLRFFPCQHKCLCMECAGGVLQSEEDLANLKKMGFHSVKPDSFVRCCECEEKAMMLSTH
uniref:Uncharacterized protein n=1 Tax=Palpitomonas bilix TaxID=652834 RepID=A0A7S3G9C5_9EUKA|mmetsp:Transcript_30212/g.78054  ORF Transcript_30212/g.78054 Transcript_30212/m.78054 type:complete len:497 (+) Transcript_30212:507-1997(+)